MWFFVVQPQANNIMDSINNNDQIHFEREKSLCSYLLICKDISFLGTEVKGNLVFFKFSPINKVQEAIDKFYKKEAEPVQPKDLTDSFERFKTEVFRLKGGY